MVTGADAPTLPGMTEVGGGRAPTSGPRDCRRHAIPPSSCATSCAARGIVTAEGLRELPDRSVVDVAGVVTHRQQPSTSKGVIFINLEDETGLVNVICTPDVWKRFRKVARTAPALEIRGSARDATRA